MGYGAHRLGVNVWAGNGDAFAQFVTSDAAPISGGDYGIYADTATFYSAADRGEKLSGARRFLLPLAIRFADRAVRRFVRRSNGVPPERLMHLE